MGLIATKTNDSAKRNFSKYDASGTDPNRYASVSNTDEGWWTIPKGELMPGELPLDGAVRELEEETGYAALGPFTPLNPIMQKGGKQVLCWAAEGDMDAAAITCNTFEIEWPPKSGRKMSFPEVDKAGWFTRNDALTLINERQAAFIEELALLLSK